jgi:hypothetical protein
MPKITNKIEFEGLGYKLEKINFIVCSFCASFQDLGRYKKRLLCSQFVHLIKPDNESYMGTFLTAGIEYYRTGLQKKNGFFEVLKIVCRLFEKIVTQV